MEMELVGDKHWSLMGEASAKHRSPNSLLSLHLELPQFRSQRNDDLRESYGGPLGVSECLAMILCFFVTNSCFFRVSLKAAIGELDESECADMVGSVSLISKSIEQLVKQRIRDFAFNDVVRK